MKLLFEKPVGEAFGGYNFRFLIPFDLDKENETADGYLGVTDTELAVFLNGRRVFSMPIDNVKTTSVTGLSGLGEFLVQTVEDAHAVLCRFTLRHINRMGELSKYINAYIKEGVFYPAGDEGDNLCKKCGAYLPDSAAVCINCSKQTVMLKKLFKIGGAKTTRLFIYASVVAFISSIFTMIIPVFNRILIDDYLDIGNFDVKMILLLNLAMLGSFLGWQLFLASASLLVNKASFGLQMKLRTECMKKIHVLSMASLSRKATGDLMTRIMSSAHRVRMFFTDNVHYLLKQILTITGITVIMLITNPLLTLFVFIPVPLAYVILHIYTRVIRARYTRQWRLGSKSNIVLNDILKGIKVVKVFGREEDEIRRFDNVSKGLRDISAKNEKVWSVLFPIVMFIINLGELLVLYFGGWDVIGGAMSIGELMQFIAYLGFIYGPMMFWARLPRAWAEFLSHVTKILDILDAQDYMTYEGIVPQSIGGNVEFKDLVFGYKAYEPVLKNINLKIQSNEMVGIVGPSGVGKSTMINLILGLYSPNLGAVLFDGRSIKEYNLSALREHIAVVFQDTFLFAGTIYENIAYAKDGASPDQIIAAAKIASAHEFIINLPDGYDTVIGENGYTLSGGERQRISIARAILKDPKLLLLDEATSSLDTETEKNIQAALKRLVKGRTTIAIAHRLSTLQNADRLIVLDDGKVIETGSHNELMRQRGTYYGLVMAQRVTGKLDESAQDSA